MPSPSLLTALVASVSLVVAEAPAADEGVCDLNEVARLYDALDSGAVPTAERAALRDELIRRSDACAGSEEPSERGLVLGAYALAVRVEAPGRESSPPGDCRWFGRVRAFASELTEAQPQNGDVARRREEIERAWAGSGCGGDVAATGGEVTADEGGGEASRPSGVGDMKLRKAAIATAATAGATLVGGVVAVIVLDNSLDDVDVVIGNGCTPKQGRPDKQCRVAEGAFVTSIVFSSVFVGSVIATGVLAGVYRKRRRRDESSSLQWAPIVAPSRGGLELGAAIRF